MSNKNYLAGRKKEYRICNLLKAEGYDIAQRSAGSHSPVDIWAVNKHTKVIKLIQAKPNNFRNSQKNILLKKYGDLSGQYAVYFEIR